MKILRLTTYLIFACSLFPAAGAHGADIQPLPVIAAEDVERLTIEQLTARSAKGDAKAQAELGARYARGDGVTTDMEKAVKLFEQSAARNEANGQYYLATAYYMGVGKKQDPAQAAHWFKKAAAQGHAGGQYSLAVMMTDGQGGLAADPKAAAELVVKSAEQGFVPAAFRLSQLYIGGLGVEKDSQKAAHWLRRILKGGYNQVAAASLVVLIETREVEWQPGDPGAPPPPPAASDAAPPAPTGSPQQAAAVVPRANPHARNPGRMKIQSFNVDGFPIEVRTRDGYVGLFGTSRKPYQCAVLLRFTWLNEAGERVPGEYLCYRQDRPAGRKALICESRHPNYVQTQVQGVELQDCDSRPVN